MNIFVDLYLLQRIKYLCCDCVCVCVGLWLCCIPTRERSSFRGNWEEVCSCGCALSEWSAEESIDEKGWRRREEEMLINTFYCWAITASGAWTFWQFHISLHHRYPQHLQFELLDQRIWRGEGKRREGQKRRREEAGRTRMRLKWSNLVMLKTSLHVSNVLLILLFVASLTCQ